MKKNFSKRLTLMEPFGVPVCAIVLQDDVVMQVVLEGGLILLLYVDGSYYKDGFFATLFRNTLMGKISRKDNKAKEKSREEMDDETGQEKPKGNEIRQRERTDKLRITVYNEELLAFVVGTTYLKFSKMVRV